MDDIFGKEIKDLKIKINSIIKEFILKEKDINIYIKPSDKDLTKLTECKDINNFYD